ncbi:MAG: BREX-1 system adenine-specific DNA-methyltransferase PglX, partial [Anaerolineae bacterium]
HHRLIRGRPELAVGEDDGLFAALDAAFVRQAERKLSLFDPHAPAVALKPSVGALRRCVALLSGLEPMRGNGTATNEVFTAHDALGWAYQYWNTEEKDRVFEKVRTQKGAKIAGADIIPATQLYTEPYMVKFLVQNSLGALWMGMRPESRLYEKWEYYVRDADRAAVAPKPVREISFLDPACGSGHFHLEAFDLYYDMYLEEGEITDPAEICAVILEHNLYGIDIDERAIQIAEAALWMKAAERAFDFPGAGMNLVATNIRLPKGKDHLQAFLAKHPEDRELRPALEAIFEGLEHADELGSLLQIEEPVERELRYLQAKAEESVDEPEQLVLLPEMERPKQGRLPLGLESYDEWKARTLARLRAHFATEAEATDPWRAFFGRSAIQGVELFSLLDRHYNVVAANPPYLGFRKFGNDFAKVVKAVYPETYVDLYTSFVQLGGRAVAPGGYVAMLTLNTWLSLDAFAPARKRIFAQTPIVVMAALGTGTFRDLSNTNAMGFCMFVLSPGKDPNTESLFVECTFGDDKDTELRRRLKLRDFRRRSHTSFSVIPGAPIAYSSPASVVRAFATHPSMQTVCRARQGLKTGDNDRFLRFVWECPVQTWRSRWHPCTRGGEYRRWRGNYYAAGDWELDGARLRNFVGPTGRLRSRPQNVEVYFRDGITWTTQTSYGFSARLVDRGMLIESSGPLAVANRPQALLTLLGIVNCRLIDYIFNLLQPNVGFGEGYFEKLPLPILNTETERKVRRLSNACVQLARLQENRDLDSVFTIYVQGSESTLRNALTARLLTQLAEHACRHSLEGSLELLVHDGYQLSEVDDFIVYERVGKPTAWQPFIQGLDRCPDDLLSMVEALEVNLQTDVASTPRPSLTTKEVEDMRRAFETGSSTIAKEALPYEEGEEDSYDQYVESEVVPQTSAPTETFLEVLSRKMGIHPMSVYWRIREGIEREGWRCLPEERRLTADRFTIIILHLLGHRWPKQIETDEPIPNWADPDGIIPLTEGTGEPTLYDRLRDRIAT